MATITPKESGIEAAQHEPDLLMASGGELRLNPKALGIDGSAPDFDERLCQLSRGNEPYDFQFSAQAELIVMAPSGPLINLGGTTINADPGIWDQTNPGARFSQTIAFRRPSNALYLPDAACIIQERFDNLTERELRGAINGGPDFVVEMRSLSDRLPPLLAKMEEWMEDGSRLGWLLDPIDRQAYIYRAGQDVEILENTATLDGEDVLPGFVFQIGRLMFGQ